MQPTVIAYASIAAVMIHFLLRVVKSGQVDAMLMRMGIPSIPDKAIPWIALGLGFVGGVTDALVQNMGWSEAVQMAVLGLFSGSGAVALHETAVKAMQPSDPPPPST